jgi:Lipocalin-like domain
MNRIGNFACAVFCFVCSAGSHGALAQESPKTLKDQLAGSWRLVSINNLRVDGSKYELFGPSAKGIVIFDRNGTYSFQIMRAGRPSFVAESRLEGTPEENTAAVRGMISHFGTYEIDEPSHSVTFRIEGSSYPNWDKTEQKRSFTLLGNQLSWSDPAAGPRTGDLQSDLIWRRSP